LGRVGSGAAGLVYVLHLIACRHGSCEDWNPSR
jgi:hypothetical protein